MASLLDKLPKPFFQQPVIARTPGQTLGEHFEDMALTSLSFEIAAADATEDREMILPVKPTTATGPTDEPLPLDTVEGLIRQTIFDYLPQDDDPNYTPQQISELRQRASELAQDLAQLSDGFDADFDLTNGHMRYANNKLFVNTETLAQFEQIHKTIDALFGPKTTMQNAINVVVAQRYLNDRARTEQHPNDPQSKIFVKDESQLRKMGIRRTEKNADWIDDNVAFLDDVVPEAGPTAHARHKATKLNATHPDVVSPPALASNKRSNNANTRPYNSPSSNQSHNSPSSNESEDFFNEFSDSNADQAQTDEDVAPRKKLKISKFWQGVIVGAVGKTVVDRIFEPREDRWDHHHRHYYASAPRRYYNPRHYHVPAPRYYEPQQCFTSTQPRRHHHEYHVDHNRGHWDNSC